MAKRMREYYVDAATNSATGIDYAHHEAHEGKRFYVQYSVPSLGAMTGDIITLTFTTPNSAEWDHFVFTATGSSGWRVRLIEAPSGGAATPTGALPILNKNGNSSNTSLTTDGTTAGQVSYNATLATGGITRWDDYIQGSTTGVSGSGNSGKRDELILKQDTQFQLSIYGTDTEAATLYIDWYEHTNKG